MVDRAPTKPNRYAVYDENHNFIRYEYHERADEPTQVGDALNKANLLPDDVASALGLTGNPQVKDALEKIKTLIDGNTTLANSKAKIATGSYAGTGMYGSDNPCSIVSNFDVKTMLIWGYTSSNLFTNGGNSFPLLPIWALTSVYKAIQIAGDGSTNVNYIYFKKVGNTIYWYSTDSASLQRNQSGFTYHILLIG